MDLQTAINQSKKYERMKVCVSGLKKYRSNFMIKTFLGHYEEAREAWLKGDLETLSDFFGIYV